MSFEAKLLGPSSCSDQSCSAKKSGWCRFRPSVLEGRELIYQGEWRELGNPQFDQVEGYVDDGDEKNGRWKQLVFQDKPYLPPSKREKLGYINGFCVDSHSTQLSVWYDLDRFSNLSVASLIRGPICVWYSTWSAGELIPRQVNDYMNVEFARFVSFRPEVLLYNLFCPWCKSNLAWSLTSVDESMSVSWGDSASSPHRSGAFWDPAKSTALGWAIV